MVDVVVATVGLSSSVLVSEIGPSTFGFVVGLSNKLGTRISG